MPTPKRYFTLVDVVILIAATAGGLALLRPALDDLKFLGGWDWAEMATSFFYGLLYAPPLLIAWSVGTLALSLRQPRPPLRILARSPGFVINTAVVAGLLLAFFDYLTQTRVNPPSYMHVLTLDVPFAVRNSVIGSMVALALFHRLRPRSVWTDWLGWAMGLLWIVIALLSWPRGHYFYSTVRERAKTPAFPDNAAPTRPGVTAVSSWSAPSS
jgi:hypothetical protein